MAAGAAAYIKTLGTPHQATFERGLELAAPVSYTHLRAHETVLDHVCRLLLEKKPTPTIQHVNSPKDTQYTHIHSTLTALGYTVAAI